MVLKDDSACAKLAQERSDCPDDRGLVSLGIDLDEIGALDVSDEPPSGPNVYRDRASGVVGQARSARIIVNHRDPARLVSIGNGSLERARPPSKLNQVFAEQLELTRLRLSCNDRRGGNALQEATADISNVCSDIEQAVAGLCEAQEHLHGRAVEFAGQIEVPPNQMVRHDQKREPVCGPD